MVWVVGIVCFVAGANLGLAVAGLLHAAKEQQDPETHR